VAYRHDAAAEHRSKHDEGQGDPTDVGRLSSRLGRSCLLQFESASMETHWDEARRGGNSVQR
jgi:hypothetical protein